MDNRKKHQIVNRYITGRLFMNVEKALVINLTLKIKEKNNDT